MKADDILLSELKEIKDTLKDIKETDLPAIKEDLAVFKTRIYTFAGVVSFLVANTSSVAAWVGHVLRTPRN